MYRSYDYCKQRICVAMTHNTITPNISSTVGIGISLNMSTSINMNTEYLNILMLTIGTKRTTNITIRFLLPFIVVLV